MTSADVAFSRFFAFTRPSVMPLLPHLPCLSSLKQAITLLVKKQKIWSKMHVNKQLLSPFCLLACVVGTLEFQFSLKVSV